MQNELSKYDIISAMASRRKEMDEIRHAINELLKKVKQLNNRHDELKSLNILDDILLKEFEEDGNK